MKRLTPFVLGAVLSLSSCTPGLTPTPPSPPATVPAPIPTPAGPSPSSTPEQTPTLTPIPAVTVSFNWLRIVYSTTSNWNRLEFLDPDCFLTVHVTDIQGRTGNAFVGPLSRFMEPGQPDRFGIFLNRTAGEINLDQAVHLSMTLDAAIRADDTCQSLRFEQQRGAWFSATASFSILHNGQVSSLQEVPLPEHAKFTVDLSRLDRSAQSTGTVQRSAKMLWAMYYPWWPGYGWDFSSPAADHPLIPAFSSEDSAAVAYQIQQAKSAGIDGFFVSYNGSWLDERLRILLDAAQANGFLIAPHLEITDTPHNRMWDTATIKGWITNFITKFGAHPALMRLNGNPVFAVYMGGSWQRSEWEPMFDQLAKEGFPASFLSMEYNLANLRAYDGIYDLGVFPEPDLTPAVRLAGRMITNYPLLQNSLTAPKIWMAPVAPGFDNSPWLSDTTYPAKAYVVPRNDGEYYRRAFESVVQNDPDWILINTWNEYGEETHIEPSQRYGNQYLDITREFAARWKRQASFPPEPTLPPPTPSPDLSAIPSPDLTPNPDAKLAAAQAFADPILAALANRPPDYQNDFSTATNDWWIENDTGLGRVVIEDGHLRIYADSSPIQVRASNQGLAELKNFVVQVDAWPETPGWSAIWLSWRFSGTSWYDLDLAVDNPPWNTWFDFNSGRDSMMLSEGVDRSIKRGKPFTITLIVSGDEYALYFNGHPASYVRDIHKGSRGEILLGASADPNQPSAVVSYDNIKLWDLDKLPTRP